MNIIKLLKKNWVLGLLGGAYLVIYLWQKQIGSFLSQEQVQNLIGQAVYQGWLGLVDYLSAHVLFCLVPAFFIAGAINSLVDTQSVLKYLSGKTKKGLAYLIAVTAGFLIEVCSCTILPLFAGIWKRGAGLGVAITFLFVGPAVNILAIAYTGAAIGMDIAIARIVLSVGFGILIGLIMARVFRSEEAQRAAAMADNGLFDQKVRVKPTIWIVFLLLVGVLIVGTLKVSLLTATWLTIHLPIELQLGYPPPYQI